LWLCNVRSTEKSKKIPREECLRLSELAPTVESKAEYRLIAGHYVTLAEAEESLAASAVK
jgi:hypothetical protein